ncbi:MAG: ATP-binding protein [Rhodocyclaceae bacterium]|nr:ATP-binding protein [Rhodocyclaceae bacterium]
MNAAQAMAERGTIIITTEPVGDTAVRILIEDNGRGIPAASLSRIFDPFYTTKPVGKGTGLGLSLSASIIERHNGTLEVSSEVGKTVFAITLPVDCSKPSLHASGLPTEPAEI